MLWLLLSQMADAHAGMRALEQAKAEQLAELTAQISALQQERDIEAASSADAISRLTAYVSGLEREKYELLDNKAVEDAEKSAAVAHLKHQVRCSMSVSRQACLALSCLACTAGTQCQRDSERCLRPVMPVSRAGSVSPWSRSAMLLHAGQVQLQCLSAPKLGSALSWVFHVLPSAHTCLPA